MEKQIQGTMMCTEAEIMIIGDQGWVNLKDLFQELNGQKVEIIVREAK